MNDKKLIYFAPLPSDISLGVSKKINNTVKAARNIGLNASASLYSSSVKGRIGFIKELIFTNADYIFIRFDDLVLPFVFVSTIYLRIRGKKIIVDIPTPRYIALKEIDSTDRSVLYKVIRKTIAILIGSWFLLPVNRVVQYADESKWFSIGIKKKTIKMGNGILIEDTIPLVKSTWPSDELKLIGVAQLAPWHGYDRVINAMSLIKNYDLSYKISFTIVGDGDERQRLEEMVDKLGLRERVFFTGMLSGADLDDVFEDKHIGVASLGLYRKGLSEASDLKTREYMSRGLLVLAAGNDIDIKADNPYRILVSNNEYINSIIETLTALKNKDFPQHFAIQEFAGESLSLESKLTFILNIL